MTIVRKMKLYRYLCIFCLVVLQILSIILSSRMGGRDIMVFGQPFGVFNMVGCITMVQLLLCVGLTCNEWRVGGRLSYFFLAICGIPVTLAVFVGGRINSLPGFLTVFCGFGFIAILRKRLKLIEANNRFYQDISVTDSLTGVANRRGMREFVGGLIADERPFYMLFMDLDNFKYVNDTIGHNVGDMILKTVARRCADIDNPGGIVSRNGSDEFIIVVPESEDRDIMAVAEKYLNAVEKELWIEQAHAHYAVEASIGVSHYPEHSTEIDDIINYADTAMYDAKYAGKNRVSMFNMDMAEMAVRKKQTEDVITEGLIYERFFLVYQPQFEAKSKKLRGFESLIRLKDAEGQIISPAAFIPVAEQSDLILEIDKYVLRRVMTEFAPVLKETGLDFVVSVNISAKHISDRSFPKIVKEILESTGYPAKNLEVEITEYCMVRDTSDATYTIKELNKMGIAIALDDFGTGYASLSNLTKLPIDLLKIDKSFIDNLSMNKTNNEFVEAIISMGHLMHCDIISEGVETDEQLDVLADSQCDFIQGFVWSKPLSYEDAVELVRRYASEQQK